MSSEEKVVATTVRGTAPAAGGPDQGALVARVALAAGPLALAVLLRPLVTVEIPGRFYLPFHYGVELTIAAIGFATFAVQWFAAGTGAFREARARFIGAALLGGAALEALHLLVFPGMPGLLGPGSTDRGIVFWLAARFWTVGALLAALAIRPDDERRLLGRGPLLAAVVAGVAAIVSVELALSRRPSLFFVEGEGLTPLKISAELLVGVLAAGGAVLYGRTARRTGDPAARPIAIALGLSALAAVAFTLYATAYDVFNLLGHLYQVIGFWYVFEALFVSAVVAPHQALEVLREHVSGELRESIRRLETTSRSEGEARAELEAAIQAVPGGLVVYAPGGAIVRYNEAARQLLALDVLASLPPGERLEMLRAKGSDGAPVAGASHPALRALAGETVAGALLHVVPPGGQPRWVAVSAAPIRDPGGGLRGAVAVWADVTELQRVQEGREDLLRATSHDLRNPLQVVMLNAERLVRSSPEGTPGRRMAEAAVAGTRQMAAILRDLVDSARLERGGLELSVEPVSLRPFAEGLLTVSAGVLDVRRVALEIPADLPPVAADRARLERIFANLVANALKYTQGPVRVRAAAEGGEIHVSVQDEGPGLAPEDVPRLFERYWRRGPAGEGLGLGLYIVRQLVEAHGGWIRAESEPARGSTFTFGLPKAAPASAGAGDGGAPGDGAIPR